ncbi:MAG: metallo-mystery pair system four-Cys motif protein [Scytonematopsis contorta HA4267-MV1]|jgi:uncharacterized repeat protein (TIGR04052 family)|nr:metallo-mystery pair system four-Cys motif protein [Scytonematopsis contorta HA4267-MV1]
MKIAVKPTVFLFVSLSTIPILNTYTSQQAKAFQSQEITIKFSGKVGNQPFDCRKAYKLGKSATNVTAQDFRFYISDVSLVDTKGKAFPLNLRQDGKWQYHNVALIDFENKTGACANGTAETRDIIVGTVPKGNYTGLRFNLGVPFNLNHEDSTLAPSPLNLTSLWWNWRMGYKFARIDFANQFNTLGSQPGGNHQHKHDGKEEGKGFLIHLGSTGCQVETGNQKPTKECSNPNRATITFNNFNPSKNTIVADIAKLVANSNLGSNQANTAPGCMSEPNDNDCMGIMASFGIPFTGKPAFKQTFFRVE